MKKHSQCIDRELGIESTYSIERPTFYYHFKDKYDLMAWIFCQQTINTDVLSIESATRAMKGMRQDYIFFKRAFEDNSQSPMWAYMHAYFVKRYTDIATERNGSALEAQTRFSMLIAAALLLLTKL